MGSRKVSQRRWHLNERNNRKCPSIKGCSGGGEQCLHSVFSGTLRVIIVFHLGLSLIPLNSTLDIHDLLSFLLHSFKSELGRTTNISLGLNQENYTNLPRFTCILGNYCLGLALETRPETRSFSRGFKFHHQQFTWYQAQFMYNISRCKISATSHYRHMLDGPGTWLHQNDLSLHRENISICHPCKYSPF